MADPIKRLVQHLARLPGIGEKTATRLAFHLIRSPASQVKDLAQTLVEVIEQTVLCSVCANITQDDPCVICRDPGREASAICVVSNPSDVVAIDRGGHFRGRFHVLHGVLSPLEGIGPEDLRIDELLKRLQTPAAGEPEIDEIIVATSANVEGEATAMYLARLIKPLNIRVSRIASGIPVGGELEYSDQATIARALAGRSPL
ncbi:recombination mediator RecR [Haliangium ochraceum]|uniref:Recombination protein RecR n=1 Tax=Haliangium ochraceum (strain DSM 14365 / JCM 11303 / SMP-2) TaxID=502025 RepID=D0LUK9_HALO1|nr:recombination mediator RecR [Haliangium ochraceum]ACY19332.1 recombination protein RecR [Haliangium ochraceum DSM 14365]